ncbi:hypothetical protein LINPERHAP2_LOCUS3365, partial [Linum perenne]
TKRTWQGGLALVGFFYFFLNLFLIFSLMDFDGHQLFLPYNERLE